MLYIESVSTIVILLYCYARCKLNSNLSRVDQVRGYIQILYALLANLHHLHHTHRLHPRLICISLVVVLWGVRMSWYIQSKLTQRGTFQQDKRWSILLSFITHPQRPWIWVLLLVNVLQIAAWFLLITPPLCLIYRDDASRSQIDALDGALLALQLMALCVEAVSDAEMVAFRRRKFALMMRHGHSIR